MISRGDRVKGSLLGLAVGDALGMPLEFRRQGTFAPLSEMISGGPFNLPAGHFTDDTSMALCLAESLVARGGFDLHHQLENYLRWYRRGLHSSTGECFDIGNTTKRALEWFEKNKRAGFAEPEGKGNGSLMRLAPVPLFFSDNIALAVKFSGESSLATHCAPECVDACRYMGALIAGALVGRGKEELLAPHFAPVEDLWEQNPLHPAIKEVAEGSFKAKNPPEIRGGGYVAASLEAALWAFHNSGAFGEGALLAVNLGDDADTTGAIYGMLAGAFYGAGGIPAKWLEKLVMREKIEDMAQALMQGARIQEALS